MLAMLIFNMFKISWLILLPVSLRPLTKEHTYAAAGLTEVEG